MISVATITPNVRSICRQCARRSHDVSRLRQKKLLQRCTERHRRIGRSNAHNRAVQTIEAFFRQECSDLGADATAEDFEDALDGAIDSDDVDAVVAVYIPPLNVSGEDVANVLEGVVVKHT